MLKAQTIQAKLALGFMLGPIILAIVGSIAYLNTRALTTAMDNRKRSFETLEATEIVHRLMGDAERGQRGFLLTASDRFLEPYTLALAALPSALDRLDAHVDIEPEQRERVDAVRGLIAGRLDIMAQLIAIRRDQGAGAATAALNADDGRKAMQLVVDKLNEIDATERQQLAASEIEYNGIAALTFNSITYGTLASFILLALLGLLVARSIIRPVNETVAALNSVSAEILAGTSEQAAGMREHSSAVTETVTTVDEVLQTSEQAAQRAQAVSVSSQRAAQAGKAGRKAVEDFVSAMGTVQDRTASIAESIVTLAEQAQAISEIIATVNDIAEQTNVLSLNAAIEASRAGEHGRGFTVVANEVKALADQSKQATAQVRQILTEIQKATDAAVTVTEQGSDSVGIAIKTVSEAGATIRTLADIIAEAVQSATQIAASSQQQATGMRQIHQAMQNINQVSVQHLAATSESEQAAKHLSAVRLKLKQLVSA